MVFENSGAIYTVLLITEESLVVVWSCQEDLRSCVLTFRRLF